MDWMPGGNGSVEYTQRVPPKRLVAGVRRDQGAESITIAPGLPGGR